MLNPETITILDPACGSGHILVEAYDLLKQIYLERGYQARAIPRLILEKNLYGLDIDDRAAQLAGFALLMKARADDRRLFNDPPKLNVMALQDSKGLDAEELARALQAVEAGSKSNAAQLSRHSGMDRRNPACRDAYPPSHPWSLGSGDPCRNDELALPRFGQDDLFPETRPQMSLDELAVAEPADNPASSQAIIAALIETFAHAKTFGSLIQIPPALAEALPALEADLSQALASGDVFALAAAEALLPLVRQAKILAKQFDVVVANPPYMGARYYDAALKRLVENHYKPAKGDLYTCFMVRNTDFTKLGGLVGMITIPNWMFLSSFEDLRNWLFSEASIETFSHNGRGVFGSDFGSCAFTFRHQAFPDYKGSYKRLFEKQGSVSSNEELDGRFELARTFDASTTDFKKIPGTPVAYWVSDKIRNIFTQSPSMAEMVDARQSLATGDNDRFLRMWQEVNISNIGFSIKNREEAKVSVKKWFPHQKGGDFRKWYGNHEWVVNWENDGTEIREFKDENGKLRSRPQGTEYYFRECVSWSDVTSASNAFRYDGHGFIPNVIAPAIFKKDVDIRLFLLAGNNVFYNFVGKVLNPTIHFHVGYFSTLPFPEKLLTSDLSIADELIAIAKTDWDASEVSWGFQNLPWIAKQKLTSNIYSDWQYWADSQGQAISRMKALEEQNNRLFIEAYGLQDELSPEVPEDQITLARADREKDSQRLISYAIGCMMGRYRLDKPGLIYAHSGNERFWEIYEEVDSGQWSVVSKEKAGRSSLTTDHCPLTTATATANPFPADADGIVPITDELWFIDDAATRVGEFLLAVWPEEVVSKEVGSGEWSVVSKEKADRPSLTTDHSPLPTAVSSSLTTDHCPLTTNLATNMQWLAESLGQKPSETPEETIRRYLADKFYKDHLQTYKKRPIYWLFSSGKQGAFQALVYLHRYHEGTLARLRSEYVVPLTGKIQTRIDLLEKDAEAATSTPARNKLNKDIEKLRKKHVELLAYDEKLRHYADRRITLDLDDGVKVNYGKFGDLLAEVKVVTGGSGDD